VRHRSRSLPSVVLMLVALPAALVASPAGARTATAKQSTGAITVSAAASLTEAFTAIGEKFQKQNPKATLTFNFGSSSTLVTQIQGGAPADVYASADLANMDKLVSGGQITATPTPFARNQMEIAVKPGNPQKIANVADLADVGTVSLCGATVPCGVYAASVLKKAGVAIPETSITRGADAKATLAAVSQGDANAAIVYVTDVHAAGTTVTGVTIPAEQNVVAVYPIAPIAGSSNPRLARAFISYVVSPAGQKILAQYGFLAA